MGSENSNDYHLPPDETGWKNAAMIARSLDAWRDLTRRINGVGPT